MYPPERLRRRFDILPNAGLSPPRHPMDERLPDGSSVDQLLRRVNSGNRPVNVPANAGLTLPQPTQPNIDLSGIQPPTPNQPPPPPTAPRIGYSTAGLSGVDRLMQRRRALEEADPESRVTDSGEILPPEKTGRFKGAGYGLSSAVNQLNPERPMFALGQLLGGGIKGLVAPRSAAKSQRQIDIASLDNDIARGLKLESMQGELDRQRNPIGSMSTRVVGEGEYPGIEAGTEIRTRVDPRTGAITDVVGPNNRPVVSDLAKRPSTGAPHYDTDSEGYLITVQNGRSTRIKDENGQPVRGKKTAEGEYEIEINGQRLKGLTAGQILNYFGQVNEREAKRTDEQRDRTAKYNAAKSEYDSLIEAEKAAETEKNRAYQTLDQMRKSNQPKEDIEQAQRAASEADSFYRSFGEKKKDAARRMQENQVTTSTPSTTNPPAPPNVTEASVRADARARGKDENEAVRKARSFGWIP